MTMTILFGLAFAGGFVVGLLVGRRNPSVAAIAANVAGKAEDAAKNVVSK